MEGQNEAFDGQDDSDNAIDVNEIQSFCTRPKLTLLKLNRYKKHMLRDRMFLVAEVNNYVVK